jgi:hypothetical protein
MADSRIDIASRALARLGEPAISAFDEDSDTAERVSQLYEGTIQQIFSMRQWHFARTRVQLPIDAAAPAMSGWKNGFLLPELRVDRVGPPLGIYLSGRPFAPRLQEYQIKGRWVYADVDELHVEYVQRANEETWPGYFEVLAVEALASVLALPVTENASKEELHRAIAYGSPGGGGRGGLFRTASEADDIGAAAQSLLDETDPIGDVRFGGGW